MKELINQKFNGFVKEHGKESAFIIISTETLASIYGGTILFEFGLYYLIPPLVFLPVSLMTTLPLYLFIKKKIKVR